MLQAFSIQGKIRQSLYLPRTFSLTGESGHETVNISCKFSKQNVILQDNICA